MIDLFGFFKGLGYYWFVGFIIFIVVVGFFVGYFFFMVFRNIVGMVVVYVYVMVMLFELCIEV